MAEKKHPSEKVQDLVMEFAQEGGDADLSSAAGLLDGLGGILSDPDIASALENLPAEQAGELRALQDQMQAMDGLMQKMLAAEAAGDSDAMQELGRQFAEASPGPSFEPDVLDPPYDAIDEAFFDDDVDALTQALRARPDLNVHLGRYGSFPLQSAMRSFGDRRIAMARLLLDHGADAGFASAEGYTALHTLMDTGDRDDTVLLIDMLVERGAPLEAKNHYGWTPLLAAVMEGSPLMMEALLKHGANVHARFTDAAMPVYARGCTAIMGAALEPEKVAVLLAHGADPAGTHEDGRGFNAYADDLLREMNDPEYAAKLEESRRLVNSTRLT